MIHISDGISGLRGSVIAHSMFSERKRVFKDILKWDVRVEDGIYEIDQFDTDAAIYLVISDRYLRHLGSVRLLPSIHDHILGAIFPHLCAGPVPTGDGIVEITRFCLSPSLRASERLLVRKQLVTALAEYAGLVGIKTYTGVAELAWFEQIAKFGWKCSALAPLSTDDRKALVGLRIDISAQTLTGLASCGMYASISLPDISGRIAA